MAPNLTKLNITSGQNSKQDKKRRNKVDTKDIGQVTGCEACFRPKLEQNK